MTEASPKKRRRFSEQDDYEPGTAPSTASSAAAKSLAISTFASLQPATKSLVHHYCDKFIKLRTKARQQATAYGKLTSDGFVPKSARIKFELIKCRRSVAKYGVAMGERPHGIVLQREYSWWKRFLLGVTQIMIL